MGKMSILHLLKKKKYIYIFSNTTKSLLGLTCWDYSEKRKFSMENHLFSKKNDFLWEKKLGGELSISISVHLQKQQQLRGDLKGKLNPQAQQNTQHCLYRLDFFITAILLGQQWSGTGETSLINCKAGQEHQSREIKPLLALVWPAGNVQFCFRLPTAEMIVSVLIGTVPFTVGDLIASTIKSYVPVILLNIYA